MTNYSYLPLIRHFDHLPGDAAFVRMIISLVAFPLSESLMLLALRWYDWLYLLLGLNLIV